MSGISAPYVSPTHTHAIAAATTSPDFITAPSTLTLVGATQTSIAGSCGAVACNATHPQSIVAQNANVVQAPLAAKLAAVTAIPTVTGVPQ